MPERKSRLVKTITVTSGKGGVGKTNVVASLAVALANKGKKVMILDADLGLSNIDVLFNLAPKYSIEHVFRGEKGLRDVLVEGPRGIKVLPATSGVQELTQLDEFQRIRLVEEFDTLDDDTDVLLIDTGAGISSNVAFFCTAAQEIIVVTSPEPTALTDAYALVKVLFTRYQEKDFRVLVNSASGEAEARDVFRRLSMAAEKFLNISLDYLGYLPFDHSIRSAVLAQKAFVDVYPSCKASLGIADIAAKLMDDDRGKVKGSLQLFFGSLLKRERDVMV